jgi:dihydropteridine reductase
VVGVTESWVDQEKAISGKVAEVLGDNKLDAVLCVAGGWAGGNAASSGKQKILRYI